LRPSELGKLEQALIGNAERLDLGRLLIAEHTRHQTSHGLDDRHRGHFAASHHEVSERDLPVDEPSHAIVEALVAPTCEQERAVLAQLFRTALAEGLPLRREHDTQRANRSRERRFCRLEGGHHTIDPQHHA
jgi:hypothetical protein